MSRVVLLDAGPLGMVTHPRAETNREALLWLDRLLGAGALVRISEISGYLPLTTEAMRLAAQAVLLATGGGPNYATWFLALHIYNQAFRYFRLGYGSTLAWILALILMIFSYVQVRLSESWVYYAAS